ncbi:DUF3995 domain-containing protein [Paenibacillus sp. 481]|uniref:DUF3995 domain-containing protein n=1 Tax=Paenibacillus sp. 481 TaxID=2835869 RepID=UPI001E655CF6|nr:DUF3995 domain-containing protein [Paenibacillus sp. 481]UHA75125.1 DUF3995 domain-containing protein [Paenibacillus sp. 481]
MVTFLAWVTGGILFLLSGVHIYWVLGGKKGAVAAIPSNGSKPLFKPSKIGTLIVAGALAIAGWLVLELGVMKGLLFPDWLIGYGGWALSIVFILRAIGEFKWLGFFKKERGTLFAKWDSALYSPLCLVIGICIVFIVSG